MSKVAQLDRNPARNPYLCLETAPVIYRWLYLHKKVTIILLKYSSCSAMIRKENTESGLNQNHTAVFGNVKEMSCITRYM